MVLRNLGKYFDLITVYKKHFNLISNEEHNMDVFFDVSNISEEFLLLFYSYNDSVLFEQMIFENIDQIKETEDTFSLLMDSILDHRILTEQIEKFYFENTEISYVNGDWSSLQSASEKIHSLELPHRMKYYLMNFFLDPVAYTKKLIKSIIDISAQISNLYENHYKVLADRISSFTENILNDIAENNKTYIIDINKPIYCSFGILNPDSINLWELKGVQFLYLGINYKVGIKNEELFDVEQLGKVLSDPNRVKILNHILRNGSTTVSTINRVFGFSGTTSYYHLSMMHKAGMLNISSKSKVIDYSINSKFFGNVLTFFKKYAE